MTAHFAFFQHLKNAAITEFSKKIPLSMQQNIISSNLDLNFL
jgi:hypothetical protein